MAAPSTASVVGQWERIEKHLRDLMLALAPHGLTPELVLGQVVHAQHRAGLDALSPAELRVRAESFARQEELLLEISDEMSELLPRLAPPGSGAAVLASGAETRSALESLRLLARAAANAALPETAQRLLGAARTGRGAPLLASLEEMGDRLARRVEMMNQLSVHTAGRADYSAHVLGKSLHTRQAEARAELAAIRDALAAGQLDPERAMRLAERLDKLHFEVALIANAGAIGQMFAVFDELENDGWVLFAEGLGVTDRDRTSYGQGGGRIGRTEAIRRGAATLKGALTTLHSRWLRIEQLAEARLAAGSGSAAGADRPFTGLLARSTSDVVEAEFANVRRLLSTIGRDDQIRAFLRDAHATAESAQTRAVIAKIAVMIGVALASSGAASFAQGGALALGSGALGAQLTGVVIETAAFTALTARLEADPVGSQLLGNFLGNLATFGALRLARGGVAASRAGQILQAGPAASSSAAYRAAQLADFSAGTLAAGATQLAQAEAQSQLRHGRSMTAAELEQAGLQGLAMLIGGAVMHHGMTSSNQLLEGAGARAAAHLATGRRLDQLARQLARTGNPDDGLRLLGEQRAHFAEQLAYWRDPRPGAASESSSRSPVADAMTSTYERRLSQLDPLEADVHSGAHLAEAPPQRVDVLQLAELRSQYARGQGSHAGDFTYDPATRTMSFEARTSGSRQGQRGRFFARLPDPISTVADWSQPNRIIGTRTLENLASGEAVLRQLAAGNFAVLRQLGVEVPPRLDLELRKGLEFGLGELPNGEIVIIRGDLAEVDWSLFPGVIARGHSHASTAGNDLDTHPTGGRRIALAELLKPSADKLLARELVFVSVPDIAYMAEHRIEGHRVFTPFILEGGFVQKPPPGWTNSARIEQVIHGAIRTAHSTRSGMPIYRAEITGLFEGKGIFKKEVYAVPESPNGEDLSAGLYMQFPAETGAIP